MHKNLWKNVEIPSWWAVNAAVVPSLMPTTKKWVEHSQQITDGMDCGVVNYIYTLVCLKRANTT